MSTKTKVGSFCLRGVPHTVERKSYGQDGKELMNFRMHQKARLTTFSTTVMDAVDRAVLDNIIIWVTGDIVEAPGYGDKADEVFTNYDACSALFDKASLKGEEPKKEDLPF